MCCQGHINVRVKIWVPFLGVLVWEYPGGGVGLIPTIPSLPFTVPLSKTWCHDTYTMIGIRYVGSSMYYMYLIILIWYNIIILRDIGSHPEQGIPGQVGDRINSPIWYCIICPYPISLIGLNEVIVHMIQVKRKFLCYMTYNIYKDYYRKPKQPNSRDKMKKFKQSEEKANWVKKRNKEKIFQQ